MNAQPIKLTRAGESLTMRVTSCQKVPVGTYPDYDFTGIAEDGHEVVLRIPKAPMQRQLDRLELTTETVVDEVLTFSRDPRPDEPTKPYWGITRSSAAIPMPSRSPDAKAPAKAAAKPARTDAPQAGGPIPGLDDDAPPPEAPPDATTADDTSTENEAAKKLRSIYKLQEACLRHALDLADLAKARGVPVTLEGVSALTAQAMIEFNRRTY